MDPVLEKAVRDAVAKAAEQIRKQTLQIPGISPEKLFTECVVVALANRLREHQKR